MISYAEVAVGDELPPLTVRINRVDLVKYAGASGDFNPIHWNERFAKSVGLPDVIAHGMFTMAQGGRLITAWTGDPGAVVEYGVRFTRPVAVADAAPTTLTVTGRVTDTVPDPDGGGGLVTVDIAATVHEQTVLARARAVVRLGGQAR